MTSPFPPSSLFSLLSLLSLTTLFLSSPAEAAQKLSLSNYESTLSSKNALVKFYMPWCGHCMSMAPAYDKVSNDFINSMTVGVYDVNCEEEEDLCAANEVQGYPTIKYFVNREEHPYDGGRDYEKLKEFVQTTLETKCDLENAEATCSEKALKFSAKWAMKSDEEVGNELVRLERIMKEGGDMKPELKGWILEREGVLHQIIGVSGTGSDGEQEL